MGQRQPSNGRICGGRLGEKATYLRLKDNFAIALYAKFGTRGGGERLWRGTRHGGSPRAPPRSPMRHDLQGVIREASRCAVEHPACSSAGGHPEQPWLGKVCCTGDRFQHRGGERRGSERDQALLRATIHLFFKYEPDIVYSIGSKADRCDIEVVGDQGTTFDLVQ